MEKNNNAKKAATITTTHNSTTPQIIITCRCCLLQTADVEVTDFLPLDSMATVSVRCENENDDADSNGIADGESPATLLDCLNGCARIGASLEDTTLPLHICLDCSQALEACCEFIRCVQNADQILRRKRRLTTKIAQMAADDSKVVEVVDPVIVAAAEVKTSNLDENHLASVANTEAQVIKHEESHPIGSLNLMDLIEDADANNCQLLSTLSYNTTLKNVNGHQNVSKTDCSTSYTTTNASSIRPLEQNIDQNSFHSPYLPLNAITRIDFEFPKTSKPSNSIQDLPNNIAEGTNLSKDEVTNFSNLNTLSAKDCKTHKLSPQTVQNKTRNDILSTHKFIPPFEKENSTNRDENVSKKLSITNIDDEIKSVKYSTLECDDRIYIVNAAIVKDLVKFHLENKGKQKYVCMFCKFMCDNKQMWERHLAVHLGAPRYKCSQCNFECRFKYYLTQHLKKVHRISTSDMHLKPKLDDVSVSWTKHYCSLCQIYFTSFIALQQHHHIGEEPYFECTHCEVSETKRENLMEHLAMQHKVFIDAQLIVAYIPNSLKPNIKSEEANINKFLNQFIRFHPKETKLTEHLCQYCGKSFQRRFHLLKHEHYVHPNDNKKENEKYFKRRTTKYARQQYTRHLRATQAEHQFKCDICHRVFKTLAERSAHVQQHHHSTCFSCVTCEATFAFEFELKYHMRTHNTRTLSTLASPRYDHHTETSSNSISEELKDRLYQLRQQKQNKKLASTNSMRKRYRPITKRRLSLASVSTTKSSESSVNSPSNTNSDEDMPSIGSVDSTTNMLATFHHDDINIAAISVADVMLPQPMQQQRAITMRRLSTSSIVTLSKFCATSNISSSSTTLPTSAFSQEPPCSISSERNFNCDFNDQPYLNDFDLDLLDCSNDFLLDFPSL